jgi:membrane protein DedA with SNARE-associated domain
MEHLVLLCGSQGYCLIFLAVLVDALGAAPIGIPLLIIAGGLAAAGKMSFGLVVLVASMAAAGGDILWYVLGRNGGSAVLGILSRLSVKNKVYLAHCLSWFRAYGLSFLMASKFIPGLATVAPPAARNGQDASAQVSGGQYGG